MRILLVDIATKHLDGLLQIAGKHQIDVVKPEELKDLDTAEYNAAILSGTYDHAVADDPARYTSVMELIRSGKLPLLGICLGFELICYAVGSELAEIADKDQGAARISPTSDGAKLFQGSDPLLVNETIRWCLDDLPKSLVRLARSETGIEAIKHKSLPAYGLQFHPEDFKYPSDGKLVYDNILMAFGK